MKLSLGFSGTPPRGTHSFVVVSTLLLAFSGALPVAAANLSLSRTIVYEISGGQQTTPKETATLLTIINNRLQSLTVGEAKAILAGPNRIAVEVTASNAEKLAEAIESTERRLAFRTGSPEFRIVANRRDHSTLIREIETHPEDDRLLDERGEPLAWWAPLATGVDQKPYQEDKAIVVRQHRRGEQNDMDVLVVGDPYHVTGKYVIMARPGVDDKGMPTIDLILDQKGADLLSKLTSTSIPDSGTDCCRRLGVLIDGRLYTAPRLQAEISGVARITGLTPSEVNDLRSIMHSEAFPLALTKVATGGTPGSDLNN